MRWGSLLLVAAVACGEREPLPGPNVVARLAGVDLRYAEFDAHLRANLGESGGALASEALSSLFDQFLTERLLVRLAAERGLTRGEEPGAAAVEALLAAEPEAPVTETAISAYYAEHVADFRVSEQVELLAIRTEDRVAADRARREITAGADFGVVARRLSVDPTAERGGDQGSVGRDSLPPGLSELLFALPVGALSEVVASADGFHLFRVVRRVPERARELDEVRDEIRRRLAGARADRTYARFVAEARSRYAVQVFDRNLPFAYKGGFPVSRPYENR